MNRTLKIIVLVSFFATILSACQSDMGFAPRRGVAVTVDSAVYHLQPIPSGYAINLAVTVVNDSDRDVFLSRDCGNWHLGRADENDATFLYLGEYGCIEGPRLQPLLVAAGDRFERTFRLTGSNSPLTRPPITIENNTGVLLFGYVFTDPTGKPLAKVRSASFHVEPPA